MELSRDRAVNPPAIANCSNCSKQDLTALEGGGRPEVFAPGATISNCNLNASGASELSWKCFMEPPPNLLLDTPESLPIIRTTGTDDVLAAALLWEMWQRGINHEQVHKDQCKDGLVLIGERDTEYGRTLLRYLTDGFLERCEVKPDGNHDTSRSDKPPVRTFTYLRGLDGMLPGIDKSGSKAPPKDDSSKSKDLRAQLEDTPPEHAEGRSQFDYLRRLADEIDRLDRDEKFFAKNGVKAIGIVGSDVYDKLLILQALRSRFKDKIFFTTDLDAAVQAHDERFPGKRDIILLSDGDDPADDREWAEGIGAARTAEIPIHCVGIGDIVDSPWLLKRRTGAEGDLISTRLHEDPLREIARDSRGEYLAARRESARLGDFFRANLEPLPSRELTDDAAALPRDRSAGFWLMGLAAILLAWHWRA